MKLTKSKSMMMKTGLLALVATFAMVLSGQSAETTVKLSDVHLCCQSCVKGVNAAVGKVEGATATADKDAGTVTLSGPDTATVQKAANALVKAGYYGKSSDDKIKISERSGAKGKNVQTLKVDGVHLCCGKCVKAVDEAVKSVSGVKAHTAEKNAESFEVTGDFNDKEVFTALHKAGLTGRVGK
jgi:copper chaperone CopZ